MNVTKHLNDIIQTHVSMYLQALNPNKHPVMGYDLEDDNSTAIRYIDFDPYPFSIRVLTNENKEEFFIRNISIHPIKYVNWGRDISLRGQ